jgi:hypothetical protein
MTLSFMDVLSVILVSLQGAAAYWLSSTRTPSYLIFISSLIS